MSHFTLASTTRSSIIEAVASEQNNKRKWLKVTDNLQADGIKHHMIVTEAKGGKPEIRDALRDTVVMGFSKTEQALYAKENKALSEAEVETKRYIQKQVGSMLGHIERLLAKAEAKADGGVVKSATTKWSRHQANLDKLMQDVQDTDGLEGLHPADAIRTIKVLRGYIPKV